MKWALVKRSSSRLPCKNKERPMQENFDSVSDKLEDKLGTEIEKFTPNFRTLTHEGKTRAGILAIFKITTLSSSTMKLWLMT